MVASFLSALGLASSSGLNAYLPLLVLALTDRFSTIVELRAPFDILSSPWVILALLLLLPIELILDKIPRLDTLSDRVHTVIRIPAGTLAMMATTGQSDGLHPIVAALVGAVAAGTVHHFKLRSRPSVTRATAGIANPVISMIEDFAVVLVSITACLTPYGVLLMLPLAGFGLWRTYTRLSSGPVRIGSWVLPQSQR